MLLNNFIGVFEHRIIFLTLRIRKYTLLHKLILADSFKVLIDEPFRGTSDFIDCRFKEPLDANNLVFAAVVSSVAFLFSFKTAIYRRVLSEIPARSRGQISLKAFSLPWPPYIDIDSPRCLRRDIFLCSVDIFVFYDDINTLLNMGRNRLGCLQKCLFVYHASLYLIFRKN